MTEWFSFCFWNEWHSKESFLVRRRKVSILKNEWRSSTTYGLSVDRHCPSPTVCPSSVRHPKAVHYFEKYRFFRFGIFRTISSVRRLSVTRRLSIISKNTDFSVLEYSVQYLLLGRQNGQKIEFNTCIRHIVNKHNSLNMTPVSKSR